MNEGCRYVEDPVYRREAMLDSLVNPDNGYSKARQRRYTEERWGSLSIWNPRVKKITPRDIGAPPPTPDFTWEQLDLHSDYSREEWGALGRRMFTMYPAQIEPSMSRALTALSAPSTYGLWQTDDWIGGLLWVELPDGVQPALSCASCHADVNDEGEIIPGLPNYDFDLGRVIDDHRRQKTQNSEWGPGRVDITGDGIFNPTVIADVRPVRYQRNLQRAATIRNSLIAVALRLETNTIAITRGAVRPPRDAILALSLYLWSLAENLPEPPDGRGRELFDRNCASCHTPPYFSGAPIPIEDVGSDDAIGRSPYRTTGMYQTPSLRGVSHRRLLTANGDVFSLEEILSPNRKAPGHPYGQNLSREDRSDLLFFLHRL